MLPPPFNADLNNEGVRHYRQSYRGFRTGHAVGTKGEAPSGVPVQKGIAEEHIDDFQGVDEDGGDTISQVHAAINAYRLYYRMYRRGYHEGAKGETTGLSSKMSVRMAASLPVAQLKGLVRHRSFSVPARAPSKYHVHLGAGRLGLGLVIPALSASGRPFAILQRPSGAWKPLVACGNGTMVIKVNEGETTIKCALVVDAAGLSALDGSLPVFACTDDAEVLKALVQRTTSYTTSLGPGLSGTVMGLLKGLPEAPEGSRPALYACENDHAAVDTLAKDLSGRVDVVHCMVDRICTERAIGDGSVTIGAEPHVGEVVVITPPLRAPLPLLGGDNIRWPQFEAEAEYWCQRKLLMVNGMHTCLAFMTLCKHEPGALNGDAWKEHALLTQATATQQENRRLWVWAVARCMFITWQHEPDVICSAHAIDTNAQLCSALLTYARETLARFSTVPDKVGRVLGGGVANRWNGRLKMIADFLGAEPPVRGGLRGELLKQAQVSEAELRREVEALVEESRRFVGVTVRRQGIVVT